MIVKVKELRNKEILKSVTSELPGWYRWWAPYEALERLLNSKHMENKYLDELLPFLTTLEIRGKKYYYVYVGVAVKESIHARLDWHINQKHSRSSVESGYLSTLRQTISSLVAGDQYAESDTNKLLDLFYVEYFPIELKMKSKKATTKIEKIEKKEMKENTLPLNIRDNKSKVLKEYIVELKKVRKESKAKHVVS